MTSKACCNFPGRSMESCDLKIANSTTIMTATRISIDSDTDHGRSMVFRPNIASTALATPARGSLNRAVSQGSCSGIDKFDKYFQYYGRGGGKQSHQSGAQTDFGKLQYNIRAKSQQQIAKAQEDGQTGPRRLAARRFPQGVD